MNKILITLIFIFTFSSLKAQKILRSTYSECNSQFQTDPDVYNTSTSYAAGGTTYLFVRFKNGDAYKFTFFGRNNKLTGITLSCNPNDKTFIRFRNEITRRSAIKKSETEYSYYDESNRKVFLWLTYDDLDKVIINWEAAIPWNFD